MEQFHSQTCSPESNADSKINAIGAEIACWGFLIGGIILIIAAAILPLRADLEWTRHQRNLALVAEQESMARNASYANMIAAIENQNPDTLQLLAQSNLGLIQPDQNALVMPGVRSDPMLFELLEPEPLARPVFAPQYSRLEKMVMVPRTRLWILAGGIGLVFVGLLPAARAK